MNFKFNNDTGLGELIVGSECTIKKGIGIT